MRSSALIVLFVAACSGASSKTLNTGETLVGPTNPNVGGGSVGGGTTGAGAPTGDMGATVGGVKDLALARGLVDQGQVPPADALGVEMAFAEYDLPLGETPCDKVLCLRPGQAVAPTLNGEQSAWLQIGMASNLVPETFERPKLVLEVVVDVSGSMTGEPLTLVKASLLRLLDKLGDDDAVGLVLFGSEARRVFAPMVLAEHRATMTSAINDIQTEGSTNMEAGMRLGFDDLAAYAGAGSKRLLVYTDTNPNVGYTTATEFEALVRGASDEGAELTFFGVGFGLDISALSGIAKLRGANAFSFTNEEEATSVVDEQFPWMFSPLAYDLSIEATASASFDPKEAYGIPADPDAKAAKADVSTLFLSKSRGGILMRLAPASAEALSQDWGTLKLSYHTPLGAAVEQTLALTAAPSEEPLGTRRAVSLAVLFSALREAATLYGTDPAAAEAKAWSARVRLEADLAAHTDAELAHELTFTAKLLDLMKARAPQGNLYSGSGYTR